MKIHVMIFISFDEIQAQCNMRIFHACKINKNKAYLPKLKLALILDFMALAKLAIF